MDSLREHTYYPTTDICLEVPARAGINAGGGTGICKAPDRWSVDRHGPGLHGNLLDVDGLAATWLGAVGWSARSFTPYDPSMESELLGWHVGNGRWCAGTWRLSANHRREGNARCCINGVRHGNTGEQSTIRRLRLEFAVDDGLASLDGESGWPGGTGVAQTNRTATSGCNDADGGGIRIL